MNASRPFFPVVTPLIRLLAIVAGGASLCACITTPYEDAKIDPTSPVAADVARMTGAKARFPTFAGIPKAPNDIRPVAQYGRDAKSILAAGAALERATAPDTWTLQGTDDFAEQARRDAGPQIDPPKPGDAEAFARALRERATPPPPR